VKSPSPPGSREKALAPGSLAGNAGDIIPIMIFFGKCGLMAFDDHPQILAIYGNLTSFTPSFGRWDS
jgi:hypothetical protein